MRRLSKNRQDSPKELNIAYFLNSFPELSQTFVLNEIVEEKKRGINIRIFSLWRRKEGIIHNGALSLVNDTWYLSDIDKKSKLRNLIRLIFVSPLRLLKTVTFVLQNTHDKIWRLKQAIYIGGHMRGSGIQHIHAHFALEAAELAMLVGMLTGIPYSFHAHALDIYVHQKLLREKMNFAKFVATVCEFNKRYLLEFNPGYPEEKIHVIRVGVDLKTFTQEKRLRKRRNLDGGLKIGSVARLMEKKGHVYLLESLDMLKRQGMEFQAIIVGEGPEEEKLKALILKYNLESEVHLVGAKDSDYVKMLLQEIDVFILPCIVANNGDIDATPTVLIEAMAMEIPVISTLIAGIPEIVPQNAGILVAPKDSAMLADAIKQVYQMSHAERTRMGEAGRQNVLANCNLELETQKLMELFL